MVRSIPGKRIAHLGTSDPIAYVRGLQQLIPLQRLDYLLARTGRVQKRKGRLLASSTTWLVIAMSLFTHSIPMVWRAFTSVSDDARTGRVHLHQKHADGWASRRCVSSLKKLLMAAWPPSARQAFFYRSLRLMGIDGTVLNMPNTPQNVRIFGKGSNQRSRNAFSANARSGFVRTGHPYRGLRFCLSPYQPQ